MPAMTACQVDGGREHTCLLPILTGGTSCCCDMCPTRYTIRPMNRQSVCAPVGADRRRHHVSIVRHWHCNCGACGAALPCPRRQDVAGTVILFGGAWPEPRRLCSDEGTLLLSLNLPNDSNAVATSLAFFRHVLVTTHLFATNHREGLDRMALAECESAQSRILPR